MKEKWNEKKEEEEILWFLFPSNVRLKVQNPLTRVCASPANTSHTNQKKKINKHPLTFQLFRSFSLSDPRKRVCTQRQAIWQLKKTRRSLFLIKFLIFWKPTFFAKPTPAKQTKAKTKTNPLSPPPPPRCCRQRPQREQKIEKEQTVNRKGGEEPRGRCEGEICEVKGRTVFLLLFSSSFSPPPLPSSVLFGLVSHHPSKLPAQRILKGRWSPRKWRREQTPNTKTTTGIHLASLTKQKKSSKGGGRKNRNIPVQSERAWMREGGSTFGGGGGGVSGLRSVFVVHESDNETKQKTQQPPQKKKQSGPKDGKGKRSSDFQWSSLCPTRKTRSLKVQ